MRHRASHLTDLKVGGINAQARQLARILSPVGFQCLVKNFYAQFNFTFCLSLSAPRSSPRMVEDYRRVAAGAWIRRIRRIFRRENARKLTP
jgi:hypothetical protein